MDYGKKVNIFDIGTVMSIASDSKDKALCFILSESHLESLGLTFKHKHNKIELIQKIHFGSIVKLMPGH